MEFKFEWLFSATLTSKVISWRGRPDNAVEVHRVRSQELSVRRRRLKVHNLFPKDSYLPSLATSCENMASNSERIMEKSRNCQIIYAGRTNQLTNYETGDSPATILSHWGQASSRKQSECGRHGLSNILKLQETFLYSKTNLFHMRGGLFHAGNTLCTFNHCATEPPLGGPGGP